VADIHKKIDVHIEDLERRLWARDWPKLIRAAAGVANMIAIGCGGMIKVTMMEDEFRNALSLAPDELITLPKASTPSAGGDASGKG
jgi:hypothetical protein